MFRLLSAAAFMLIPALSSADSSISGECTVSEVAPILEWQYVSSTCYENHSQTCNCDEHGCQTCTENVPYECGERKWVRTGSKFVRPIVVKAELILVKVGHETAPGKYTVGDGCPAQIDEHFSGEKLAIAVIKSSGGIMNPKVQVIESTSQKMVVKISAETIEANYTELTRYFENVRIPRRDRLVLPALPNLNYVKLVVCIGKKSRLGREIKYFGCEYQETGLEAGELVLSKIDFDKGTRRKWIYNLSFQAGTTSGDVQHVKSW